jgi:hypothetical protein
LTVSGTTFAVTLSLSSSAGMSRSRSAATVVASSRLVARSAYDVTRCAANWPPWNESAAVSDAWVVMNRRAVDWYCGVAVNVKAAAAATTTKVHATISGQRRRSTRR